MKTQNLAFPVAAGSLLALAIGSFAGACSSNANGGNPAPSTEDSGNDVTSSSSSGSGSSSGTGSDGSSGSSSGGVADATSLDTGSCVSDASTCNSCYTAAQAAADPYNACSPYTTYCTRFDIGRVPLIDGGVPPVP